MFHTSVSVNARPANNMFHPKQLALSMPVDEIHVWQVRLTDTAMLAEGFWDVLNEDEKQKALRLRSEMDQARSIVSRGILRNILGWYLSVDPASIEFSYGAMGKPFLVTGQGLDFNVTHSDDLILYAFTYGRRVGIDVEHMNELPEFHDMARHLFSSHEQDLLTRLPASDQKKTFFRLWTLREACAKMQGDGLVDELKNMDILSVLKEQDDWTFETFAPLPEYAAAVVVEGSMCKLVRFDGFPGIVS